MRQPVTKDDRDGHYHFGMSIANDLRQMTPALASMAKVRISQTIFDLKFSSEVVVIEGGNN